MFFWNFEVYPVRENEAESGVSSSGMVGRPLSRTVTRNDYYVTFIHEDLFCLYR